MILVKTCPSCGEDKPLDEYYVWHRPDGQEQRASYCRPCHSEIKSVARRAQKYGLTAEELAELLADARCGICGRELDRSEAHIDHDHATGNVRSVLCLACNVGLGHFHDDQTLLKSAIRYLKRHSGKRHDKTS